MNFLFICLLYEGDTPLEFIISFIVSKQNVLTLILIDMRLGRKWRKKADGRKFVYQSSSTEVELSWELAAVLFTPEF